MNNKEVKLVTYLNDHYYRIHDKGKEYVIPSVTTKLGIERKPYLERWRGDVGNERADQISRDSRLRGKRIHHAMRSYFNGGTVIFNPSYEEEGYSVYTKEEIEEFSKESSGNLIVIKNQDEMVDMWKIQQFDQLVKPKALHTEQVIYSIERMEAGTLDIAFWVEKGSYPINGYKNFTVPKSGVIVADLKTGSLDQLAWSQMAVYLNNYIGMGYAKQSDVLGAAVLHTGSNTKSGIEGFAFPFKTTQELGPYYDMYKNLAAAWDFRNPNAGPKNIKFPSLIKR